MNRALAVVLLLPLLAGCRQRIAVDVGDCPAGQISCDDRCVDSSSDPANCGGCGRACSEGLVCRDSGCSSPCPTQCGGFTYCDTQAGECREGCASEAQCTDGRVCDRSAHRCVCPPLTHQCYGSCYEDSSTEACGAECRFCPGHAHGDAVCAEGECSLLCETGYHLCGSACLSSSSPQSCGDRCEPCLAQSDAHATCISGECGFECDTGFHLCGEVCVSSSSTLSCGDGCEACPEISDNGSATCDGESCGFTCDRDYLLCEGRCVACVTEGVARHVCDGAVCLAAECEAGYHFESGACVPWRFEKIASLVHTSTGAPSAIDPTGAFHVAFVDGPVAQMPSVLHAVSSQAGWSVETVHGEWFLDLAPDLAIDSRGFPAIAFSVYSMGEASKVGRWDGAAWQIETLEAGVGLTGPQIEVGPGDVLRAAWGNESGSAQLYSAVREQTGWRTETVDTGDVGWHSSLAFDSSGRPHLIYFQASLHVLRHAVKEPSGWIVEQAAGDVRTGAETALAVDPAGGLHAVFEASAGLTYVRHTEAGWLPQELVVAQRAGRGLDIAVDAEGRAHVVFADGQADEFGYARREAGGWRVERVDAATGEVGAGCSIVLDGAGAPHLFFADGTTKELTHAW